LSYYCFCLPPILKGKKGLRGVGGEVKIIRKLRRAGTEEVVVRVLTWAWKLIFGLIEKRVVHGAGANDEFGRGILNEGF
jgi:hypothetical protein